jgi:hypothetical protein
MKKIIILGFIFSLGFLLRFYHLGSNPPSLYWDEASLGYNAYTISTTLRDEHGEYLPLARFIAFGDYKPPGYIYATVPFILIFGVNEFAVRLPSMLAGVLMVIVTYFLVKELFKNDILAYLSSFFLAVSPWSIHMSRAAFEANLAAFFNLLAIYFFILGRRKKWTIVFSFISFVLSFYTFNANRIIAPVILLVLIILYHHDLRKNAKWFIFSFLLSAVLIFPSLSYLSTRESRLRYEEVTIFNNLQPVELANARIATDGGNIVAKLIHNRRLIFFTDYLKHYFDNFTGRFLFTHGDVNPRLSVQGMGQLYVWDLPFLLIGLYLLVKQRTKSSVLIFSWMLVAPIPAGTARETPHALRILSILPTFQIVIAYGVYQTVLWLKQKFSLRNFHILLFLLSFLLSVNLFYYLHIYHVHFPINWSGEWQYGYKEMVNYVNHVEDSYDQIFVTTALGRPYIYFAFYDKYPLDRFLNEEEAQRDWFGFWDVKRLGKIIFGGASADAYGKILVVAKPGKLTPEYRLLKVIKDLSGNDVFWIGEKT